MKFSYQFSKYKERYLIEWSYIYVCVSTIDFASVYKIFRLDLGTFLTMVFLLFTLLYRPT